MMSWFHIPMVSKILLLNLQDIYFLKPETLQNCVIKYKCFKYNSLIYLSEYE